jgi:uncharacterized protein DUF1707
MTDESLPSADRNDLVAPDFRASHEDRERVADLLRVAAGDGRLTPDELDERLEVALTARTTGELAELTADLPDVGGRAVGAKDVVRIDGHAGNAARRGRWVVPRRMEIGAIGGSVTLDFTDAVVTHPTLDIEAHVQGGRLLLVTRPDIEVDIDELSARGGRIKVRPDGGSNEPVCLLIRMFGEADGGSVVVRWPRRTFRQWVRRKP